jgi:succinyl-CoA synthetase alpha subunit
MYRLCGIIDQHIDRASQNSVSIEPSDHDQHHSTSSFLVVPVYKTIADAIASTNVQIAVIACPPQFAQDYADEALQSGLDVLMENHRAFIPKDSRICKISRQSRT